MTEGRAQEGRSEAASAHVLALAGVAPAVDLGPAPLGDRGGVGLLPPLVALALPGLGLHGSAWASRIDQVAKGPLCDGPAGRSTRTRPGFSDEWSPRPGGRSAAAGRSNRR